jgi:hypothetical protein
MDTGDISRMSKTLSQGKNRKRYNGYYWLHKISWWWGF